ncbi:MAG: NAD(P)H-binding protein [Lachnospiraceae bacterium]|nr:NAD(P)H-binding protein [Lachnospiraceae bacterium]
MKILVLGGTGAMGKPVVQILAERKHQVYVTTRQERKSDMPNVRYLIGNAHDVEFIHSILKQRYDAIIDFMIYNPLEFQKSVDFYLENTGQYIFISSARVYADASDTLITEESPRLLDITQDVVYLKTNEYALAKAREENILLDGKYGNYTIIRPYITYNDERLQLGVFEKEHWLQRALKGKTIVFSKDIAERTTTLTYGYDVALRIADLTGKSCAMGQIYNIAADRSIQWKDVLEIYLEVLEKHLERRPKVYITEKCDALSEWTRHYQVHSDRLFDRKFSAEKVQRDSGEKKPFTSPEEGLRKCLQMFLAGKKEFLYVDWKREGIFDNIADDRTKYCDIPGAKNKVKYFLCRHLK